MPSPVRLETENVGFSSELVPERPRQFVETLGRKIDIAVFLQEGSTELFVDEAVQRLVGVLLSRRCCRHVRFRQSFRELIGSPRLPFARISYESAASVTAAVIHTCWLWRRSVIHWTPRSLACSTPAPRIGNLYALAASGLQQRLGQLRYATFVSRTHEVLGALLFRPAKEQAHRSPFHVFDDQVRTRSGGTR